MRQVSEKKHEDIKQSDTISQFEAYTPLYFDEVNKKALAFAAHIKKNLEKIVKILTEYESYDVARDEIDRALDLLTNLTENEEYFKLRIGSVATFLPRNQPLYALSCFVVVPSLMASEVHFRIPTSMKEFFPKLLSLLEIERFFPNVYPTIEQHHSFLRRVSALRINPHNHESIPVTDAVIFTGTPVRADQLRSIFDSRTLFITNGSGHNPIIVSKDANVKAAVEAALCLQLYNQGQDCAAPNSILVHKDVFDKFYKKLLKELPSYKIGLYTDRKAKIGPISDPFDLVRIEEFLIEHKEYIDKKTPGIIRAHDAIVEPTILLKPLSTGGNFTETFAPIIILQKYDSDTDLSAYFDNPMYMNNAMYVTVYGSSDYAVSLINRRIKGKLLHDKNNVLFNTHLHAPGVERGVKPYGGYGYGGSNLWFMGEGISKPTLPQRDIYECVVKYVLEQGGAESYRSELKKYTQCEEKNIEKLLRFKGGATEKKENNEYGISFVDTAELLKKDTEKRYRKTDDTTLYKLLSQPRFQFASALTQHDLEHIRTLRKVLLDKQKTMDEFATVLYAITGTHEDKEKKLAAQKRFFVNVYELLFGKTNGPRLTAFLWEVDPVDILPLLDF